MSVHEMHKDNVKGIRAGLVMGFAAPLLYLGSLPPYQPVATDNVEKSWRAVGGSLNSAMASHRWALREREG